MMTSLLARAPEQEISLPVAHLLVSVRTDSQLFKLAAGRGLNDGRARHSARLSGSLNLGPRLPREDLFCHLG